MPATEHMEQVVIALGDGIAQGGDADAGSDPDDVVDGAHRRAGDDLQGGGRRFVDGVMLHQGIVATGVDAVVRVVVDDVVFDHAIAAA